MSGARGHSRSHGRVGLTRSRQWVVKRSGWYRPTVSVAMVASNSDIGENPPELVCRTRHLVLADDQTVFLDTRFRWMCSRGGPR